MSKSRSLNDDEAALLSDHDDDFYGLWEVDWHFNGTHPDWPWQKRKEILSGVVRQGLMSIFFGPLMTEREPLAPAEALQALANPISWAEPSEGQKSGYYVATSAQGLSAIQPNAE